LNRRSSIIVVGLLVVALVGVALLAIPGSPLHKSPTLGLDLQGGLEVTLQAVPPKGKSLQSSDLDRSVTIMRDRVDKLGVAEPEIRKQGSDQIVIQLPGIKDPEAAAKVIGKTAQLELFDLQGDLIPPSIDASRQPIATRSIYNLLVGQQSLVKPATAQAWYLFNARRKLVRGPADTRDALLRPNHGKVPSGYKVLAVPGGAVVVNCGIADGICPGVGGTPTGTSYYLFRYNPQHGIPEMTGADLQLSGTRQDFDPQTGLPIVLMQFTGAGQTKFENITRELAQRGKLLTNTIGQGQNIFQNFAIVLDREIKSWPQIDWTQYPNGITGGNGAQITGLGSIGEAKDLAIVLQTGALPVKFQTLDRTDISATLGKDSLSQAKTAALAGLLLVAIFLLVFYRFLGLVAVAGLLIYAAFLYAAIVAFNVTLTLPGFAGLVLTFGVAADANVVIFERIKEEVRAGRSVRAAVAQGYAKGFHTIIDANVVTAITAMLLFAVATASVRGFALMLLIGTALSMLTAVLATRAILALLAGFEWFDSPRLMGATGQGVARWLRVDFIGKRRIWFSISAIVVAVSLGALVVKGLNLGIDFKGGTQITFKTQQPTGLDTVRSQAAKIGQANAVIQGRGTSQNGNFTSFQIRTPSLSTTEQNALESGLTQAVGAQAFGAKNVSESFGKQIARSALWAIVVSLLLIVLYISVRFQWKYSVGAFVALAHDVVITVGIYALTGREVSTATVAAVLTVLGYSIYDTIIIFDRIRENLPLMRKASVRVIGNVSLWEVLPRSLATTFITLLPVASLYLFGGDTLKDFAFALLVGIGSGAYSSIFVAAPLFAVLKEREPEFARRRDDLGALEGVSSVGGALAAEAAAVAASTDADEGDGEAEADLEDEPEVAVPAGAGPAVVPSGSKRERRRQRRASRPHGRAR
jgi:SecD/SecF fusion protein